MGNERLVAAAARARAFPPPRDFSSLSIRDLLEARETYHVPFSNIDSVVGTAIGRYRIHEKDWYADHPPGAPRQRPKPSGPRTFENSVVRPWSWPCVMVLVREWLPPSVLKDKLIPPLLFLPDGRTIPTCVVLATPDETPAPPPSTIGFASQLLGGGYSCTRSAQGFVREGSIGCLVEREGTYYALTNRHVAGPDGGEVDAVVRGQRVSIGRSDPQARNRVTMSSIFPEWPGEHTFVNIDAGLIRLDDVARWTSQVFGIGEVADPYDATPSSLTLDIIGCPVRAFGGASGVLEGEIQALFMRYKSLGEYDYVCDVVIGRREPAADGTATGHHRSSVDSQPGDSGTLWFYDPPNLPPKDVPKDPALPAEEPADRGARARRLRPIAMQWGGQRLRYADGATASHALATFVSTVCRVLDVDIVRAYGTGHDEYWGKIGHFSIGWKACDVIDASRFENLALLMKANQPNIGFSDATLSAGSAFRMGRGRFVPLADVPDYVWVTHGAHGRVDEGEQHFADVDIVDIDGGPSMLDRCVKDPTHISASRWLAYFDGFKGKGVGPDEGSLPFRVWQLWDVMADAARQEDVLGFVTAAGVLAHYVGDASQPLHCSWLHHGRPPTTKIGGHDYPPRKGTKDYTDFHSTAAADIHGLYEERMLELEPDVALAGVDADLRARTPAAADVTSGFAAARVIIDLMDSARTRLSPEAIIAADDAELKPTQRATKLWNSAPVRRGTIASLADSTCALARMWQGAWGAGHGDRIRKSALKKLAEAELQKLYEDTAFAPSLALADLAASGTYEPTATKSPKTARTTTPIRAKVPRTAIRKRTRGTRK
jgi:hypothetical protein